MLTVMGEWNHFRIHFPDHFYEIWWNTNKIETFCSPGCVHRKNIWFSQYGTSIRRDAWILFTLLNKYVNSTDEDSQHRSIKENWFVLSLQDTGVWFLYKDVHCNLMFAWKYNLIIWVKDEKLHLKDPLRMDVERLEI